MNFNTLASSAIHTTVQDWAQRVQKNGGAIPSGQTQRALSNLMIGLDSYGIAVKMKTLNCFVPDNLIAAITPLVKTYGNDPWTNNGPFVAEDLTVNGLKGNGASKYLMTGVIPDTAFPSVNSAGMSSYNTFADGNLTHELGTWGASSTFFQLLCGYGGSNYFDCHNAGTGRISGVGLTNGLGFTSGNRTDASNEYIYVANSSVAFNQRAGPGGAPGANKSTFAIHALAVNNQGAAQYPSHKRLSFAAIHEGLPSPAAQALYNLVQTMRQSLGGGYV